MHIQSKSILEYSHPCHAPVLPYIYLLLYKNLIVSTAYTQPRPEPQRAAPLYQHIYIHTCIFYRKVTFPPVLHVRLYVYIPLSLSILYAYNINIHQPILVRQCIYTRIHTRIYTYDRTIHYIYNICITSIAYYSPYISYVYNSVASVHLYSNIPNTP